MRPFHEALVGLQFDVFWDMENPAGVDWEAWIKERLRQARCVIVFWSADATASKNVKYEAEVAERAGKLVEVRLEPLQLEQMRMGSFAIQAVRLEDWQGNLADPEWLKMLAAVEGLATPAWLRRKVDELHMTIATERRRVRECDDKVELLQFAHDREVSAQGDLRRERDRLALENAELKHEIGRVHAHVAHVRQELQLTSDKFLDAYRRHFVAGHERV